MSIVYPKKIKGVTNFDVYIGKQMPGGGWKLKKSIFYNPYEVGETFVNENGVNILVKTPEESIARYWNMIVNFKADAKTKEEITEIRKEILFLKNKTLGCWCKGQVCHGEVLIYLSKEWNGEMDGDSLFVPFIPDRMSPSLRNLMKKLLEC